MFYICSFKIKNVGLSIMAVRGARLNSGKIQVRVRFSESRYFFYSIHRFFLYKGVFW